MDDGGAATTVKPAPAPTSRGGRLVVVALIVAGAVGIGALSWSRARGPQGETVRVAVVQKRDVTSRVLAQGKAKARRQVEVASELSGRVAVVHVKLGDVVKQGDPLFALESDQWRNAVEQLRTATQGAESMARRADLGVQEAEKNLERDEKLHAKNVLPEDQLRASRARVELARADREQAAAGLQRAKLDLERARDALSKSTVRAPIAGTVVAVGVEVGQVVSPTLGASSDLSSYGLAGGAAGGPSPPVVVADLSELVAKLEVDELDVGVVKPGQRVVVGAQGIKDARFEGAVERVGLMGREQGGAVLFHVDVAVQKTIPPEAKARVARAGEAPPPTAELPAPAALLRPGMSVTGEVEVDHLAGAVVVPLAAVLEGDGEGGEQPDRVFVVEQGPLGTTAKRRAVKLGAADDDVVAVLSGLDVGERVVEGPYRALRSLEDGDPVRVDDAVDAGPKK